MPIPLLDVARELQPISSEIQAQWRQLLERPQFLNGHHVRSFEGEMASFLGVPHVVGMASGTEALILGLAACGIGEGDEVILPANAFIADLEAIWWLKARPVLIDIQEWDLGPDPEQIRRTLTRKTKALLIVHLYGLPVNLAPVAELCRQAGIHLIEDCSHAPGARYQGKRVGGFGAVGCFSAGVVKNLGACGEAGYASTLTPEIARQLQLLRAHGQAEKNVHVRYGTNGRLDEMQAAVLRIKLRTLDERNARRQEIARLYSEAFSSLDILTPWEDEQRTSVYHQYVIRTRQRDALRAHLRARGVETGVHYPTPLHRQPPWQSCYQQQLSFPRAEHAAQEIVSLPVFPDLTQAEIDAVIDGVRSFFLQSSPYVHRPQLSFVAPFHNEEGNINTLQRELKVVADGLGIDYECVFVDDGSMDRTGRILDEVAVSDPHVRVVHLPKNQGEAAALSAGFQLARGQILVTLDGDGQNDPRDIPTLLAKMKEGYPVVTGWRRERQEGYLPRILPSLLANRLIAWVTGIPVHDCGCGLKAYRRHMLAGLSLPKGMHRFLPVILQIPAEAIAEVPVNDRARQSGQSHYGLSRMFSVIRDLLPIHCIRRGSPTTPQSFIGAALIAASLGFFYLVDIEFSASSLGKLMGLLVNAGSVLYLALAYRRIGEFIKAQQQADAGLSKQTVEIGG